MAIDLGGRISICEKIAGSRAALAERTGISVRTLENYSQGRNDPKASACLAIAQAVEVSVEWLLTGTGSPSAGTTDADRKIVYNIAYYLAHKSRAVKADPDAFAESFLALFDYCREKQHDGEGALDPLTFENVVEFASKRLQRDIG